MDPLTHCNTALYSHTKFNSGFHPEKLLFFFYFFSFPPLPSLLSLLLPECKESWEFINQELAVIAFARARWPTEDHHGVWLIHISQRTRHGWEINSLISHNIDSTHFSVIFYLKTCVCAKETPLILAPGRMSACLAYRGHRKGTCI